MENPVLTVITVVYNNVEHIERTLISVINQTYKNIEYIVIDGASTDGTLEIINQYSNKIATIISEKDDGIYYAMNKGLALAKGNYVLFMNSGDEIFEPATVEKIFILPYADIYYGETLMINDNLEILGQRRHKSPTKLTLNSFKYGMSVSHQAIYINTQLLQPYNTNFKLSADIDWILNAIKKSKTISNTNMYVAKYLVGGMSKTKHWQSLKERFLIFKTYYGLLPTLFNHTIIAFKLSVYWLKNKRTND
ncbi:MAG: glycosyltransferase [Sphingobacteriales bacterium]|nr:MAG: glycosyltransferase [Sphingobacteriales bacterium]